MVAIETCHLAADHVVAIGTISHVMRPIDTCRYYATKGLTSRMQHLRGGGGGNLLGSACHFFEAGTHLRSASLNV